jgi:excisionase family DNA binding protein
VTSSPLLTTVSDLLVRLEVVAAKLYAMLGRRPAAPDADVLTIKQAARFTTLSPTKIRREIKASRLPASNAGSDLRPLYRIQKLDLLAWLERKKGGMQLPPATLVVKRRIRSRHFDDI